MYYLYGWLSLVCLTDDSGVVCGLGVVVGGDLPIPLNQEITLGLIFLGPRCSLRSLFGISMHFYSELSC